MVRFILLTLSLTVVLGQAARGQLLPTNASVNIDSLIAAQANDSLLAQTVESRKGFIARVPAEARLDSTRSGWNPKELFERRVYVIAGAGEIVFTATVKPATAPQGATKTNAYTYVERDSLTAAGTAWIRTYYLATRTVRMEIVPYGIAMRRFLEERNRLFNSFRWASGAETDAIDIPPTPVFTPPSMKSASGLGG